MSLTDKQFLHEFELKALLNLLFEAVWGRKNNQKTFEKGNNLEMAELEEPSSPINLSTIFLGFWRDYNTFVLWIL